MRKSDVVIGIVPGDEMTRFFVKNEHFEYLPDFVIEYYEMETPDGLLGEHRFSDLGYNEMLCMARLFEAVADWIKPETPKKVKEPQELEVTRVGWMAPGGVYFPVKQLHTHATLAEEIWEKYYNDEQRSPETWASVQTDLMRLGWLRFDYSDVTFMRKPTGPQRNALDMMLLWKTTHMGTWTSLDLGAFEKMQRICAWLDGDAVEDYQDLEEEIEK